MSEAVKLLKGQYVVRAIEQQKMDRALIFCRTKLDCDNLEQYFITLGGGKCQPHVMIVYLLLDMLKLLFLTRAYLTCCKQKREVTRIVCGNGVRYSDGTVTDSIEYHRLLQI